jgi:hypothetical protein
MQLIAPKNYLISNQIQRKNRPRSNLITSVAGVNAKRLNLKMKKSKKADKKRKHSQYPCLKRLGYLSLQTT